MSDYIKREDAIETLEGWKISGGVILATVPSVDVVEADKAQKEIDYWHDKAQSYEQTILKLALNKADVVEVVRCKDCKHRDTNECPYDTVNYMLGGWDFCSSGERADA